MLSKAHTRMGLPLRGSWALCQGPVRLTLLLAFFLVGKREEQELEDAAQPALGRKTQAKTKMFHIVHLLKK